MSSEKGIISKRRLDGMQRKYFLNQLSLANNSMSKFSRMKGNIYGNEVSNYNTKNIAPSTCACTFIENRAPSCAYVGIHDPEWVLNNEELSTLQKRNTYTHKRLLRYR